MQIKICQKLYAQNKWSERICQANCSRIKQIKCSFLEQRITEEANNPDKERDINEDALHLSASTKR